MKHAGKVLVTGATGNTGTKLVTALRRAGVEVRVFVRDAAKAGPLKASGAEVYTGDLDDPGTIAPAVEGIDKIYLLTWNGPTQAQQAGHVIRAARRAGRIHLVRHSMWGPDRSRIIQQGNRVEEEVKASGLPWTILKPTFFMQNIMMASSTIASQGTIYWDMKEGKIAMIDVRDVADAAAAVLTGEGHEGKSYILTGPAAISFHEVAAALSNLLHREVKYVNVPGEAALRSMTGMGLPEWIAGGYTELAEGFSENFAATVTENVRLLTGHPPRSIDQFVRDVARVFGLPAPDRPRTAEVAHTA